MSPQPSTSTSVDDWQLQSSDSDFESTISEKKKVRKRLSSKMKVLIVNFV